MPLDPYRNLAEILEGTVSLMNYYAGRMDQAPSSLEPGKESRCSVRSESCRRTL